MMRRTEKEIVDKDVIEEILAKSEICRIAMTDGDEAYIVPLNYGYSENVIYMHSAPEGRKMKILKSNNKVCFEIEYSSEIKRNKVPCKWTTKYRSLIGYGRVEIITDLENKKRGLDIIMSKYGETSRLGYDEILLDRLVVLSLKIDKITGKQSGIWD